ncbi:MAG: ABC transporter permease subunit [Spirochaetaceae bacterium]
MLKQKFKTSSFLFKIFYNFIIPIVSILLLASLPLVIGNSDGKIRFRFLYLLLTSDYIKGIFDGSSFVFNVANFRWNAFIHLPKYFLVTLFYVGISSFIGIVIGFPIGLLRYKKQISKSQNILNFISSIPDFIIILFLQLFAVYFKSITGVRFAKISGLGSLPLLLPFIAMSLYPVIYVIKQVSRGAYEVSCQNYIQFARAKGLKRSKIIFSHIIPALLPGLSVDVTKVTTLVLANVFITERLFRITGITTFMFKYSFLSEGGYQFGFVVSCLLYIFLIYLIVSISLKLIIYCIRIIGGGL